MSVKHPVHSRGVKWGGGCSNKKVKKLERTADNLGADWKKAWVLGNKGIGRNENISLDRRYEINLDLEIKISRGRVYMYTHGWFMLIFGRKQNSIKQLPFN